MPRAWLATDLRSAGFSLVEVLLALSIFSMLLISMIGTVVYGQAATAGAGERGRATTLADEGLEAVRNLRDASYTNLTDGTYGLVQTSGQWALSGTSDTTGIFSRQVTIASNGTARKTVTATVSWTQGASTAQASSTTELTNWMANIKSWLNSTLSGSYDANAGADGYRVATAGNYAYLIRNTGTPNFFIVDISNPAAPTLASSMALAGAPTNIAVSGSYAYVSNSNSNAELQIINVATPASPTLTATYNASGTGAGLGVAVSGNYVYLTRNNQASSSPEFMIINVSIPAAPVLVGSIDNNIASNEVYISGNYAYIATASDTQELLVVNIATPALPTVAGSLNLSGTTDATSISGFGSTVLIGQGSSLVTVNVATPASPALLGSVTTTGGATINNLDVDTASNMVFLGTANNAAEFQIVSIATLTAPSIVKTIDVAGNSSILGIAYSTSLDTVVAASASDTQELITFVKG